MARSRRLQLETDRYDRFQRGRQRRADRLGHRDGAEKEVPAPRTASVPAIRTDLNLDALRRPNRRIGREVDARVCSSPAAAYAYRSVSGIWIVTRSSLPTVRVMWPLPVTSSTRLMLPGPT